MSRQITECCSGDDEDYDILSSEPSLTAKCSIKNNSFFMTWDIKWGGITESPPPIKLHTSRLLLSLEDLPNCVSISTGIKDILGKNHAKTACRVNQLYLKNKEMNR